MTVVEHRGTGVVILDRYPWRLELSVGELFALADLAGDPECCRTAAALAREDRLAGLLRAAAELSADDRLRLIDQCAAVADGLSPPFPAEPAAPPATARAWRCERAAGSCASPPVCGGRGHGWVSRAGRILPRPRAPLDG